MRLLIMGAPGAGKGTQAKFLASWGEIPAISTGDILRANVTRGTELGHHARRYMDAGEYVPDSLTNAMVRNRLGESDAGTGFVLDGYPRTVAQVAELDSVLDAAGHALDAVVVLTIDPDELVQRLLRRARIEGRADDTADVINRRQQLYADQTSPLIDVYRDRGLVVAVDGFGEVEEVTRRLLSTLARMTAR